MNTKLVSAANGMGRVLDTNIVLYALGGRLTSPLQPDRYFISVITEMELLSFPGLTSEEEERIRLFVSKVHVCQLTKLVRVKAVELRRSLGLKLPDAIIAATAAALNCELLTNDKVLLGLAEIQSSSLPLV